MSKNDWIFDLETYPRTFTATFEHVDAPLRVQFEISEFRNDTSQLLQFLNYIQSNFGRLVGYNNIGFDYPILHQLMRAGRGDAPTLYAKAMAIIGAQEKQDRWAHLVKPSDRLIPQLDLYLVHHFDNQARATSLKALEFNMRSDTIEDLPFPVGTVLTPEQVVVLKRYNAHDVAETKKFYHHSKHMIAFREELSEKYPGNRDWVNFNDTKIGKEFFAMELEKAGIQLYDYSPVKGRTPRQTKRSELLLGDAVLPWIQFQQPEFQRILNWVKQQTIYTTKGAFKDITANVGGVEWVFGTGGMHASLKSTIIEADAEHMILDLDVASYYPNLAIKNGFYPEHLGQPFVHIYSRLFEQRKQYPKKSAESAMIKLALNGVYGDSGNPYSVFFDQLFTMKITLNGQFLLCLLAEWLMTIPGLRVLQANTDGLTVYLRREHEVLLRQACDHWSKITQLTLEDVEYKQINIRDSNNYIAVGIDGKVKRKGAYEWQAGGWYDSGYNGWNQDASALVVPKVAEKVLVEGANIRQTVENWPDVMDFMIRVKVPRSGYLQYGGEIHNDLRNPPTHQLAQNTSRYVVVRDGWNLRKWLPPLGGFNKNGEPRDKWRHFNIESGWVVMLCNSLDDESKADHLDNINYEYYIIEVEKLVMVLSGPSERRNVIPVTPVEATVRLAQTSGLEPTLSVFDD